MNDLFIYTIPFDEEFVELHTTRSRSVIDSRPVVIISRHFGFPEGGRINLRRQILGAVSYDRRQSSYI